jgi:iron complex outermembrane receptor protein
MNKKITTSIVASFLIATTQLQANSTHELSSITVSSSLIQTTEAKATYATEIYTKEDIEKTKSKDVYDFLNAQTSVNVSPSFGNTFSQKIDFRGYGINDGYQNIVISINGRRLNNIDMTTQLLSSIPIESIERIEIIKGSGSVQFGDGANAGVINIITNAKNDNYVKMHYGNDDTKNGTLSLGYSNEKFVINGFVDYSSTHGTRENNTNEKDSNFNKNKKIDILYFLVENLELRVGRSFSNMRTKYGGSLTLDEYKNNPNKANSFTEQYFNSYVTTTGLTYDFNNNYSIDINYNDENKLSEYSTGWKSEYDYSSLNTVFNIKKDDYKIALGVDGFDGDRVGSTNTTTKENKAFFINGNYSILDNISFNLGGRNEKVEYTYAPNTGTTLNDSFNLQAYDVGINYVINENNSFFINYNRSFQAPDIDRFFSNGNFNGFIQPAKVRNYTIGYNNIQPKNKLKISLFRSDLDNEIYYYKTGPLTGRNTNIDKSHKYGIEIFDKYLINKNLYTSINYSYVISKIDKEDEGNGAYNGKDLPGVSKHNLTLNLGYTYKKLNTILSHTYRSSAYAANDFENNFDQKQEAYNSTDLSASYNFKNIELFAKIQNLFDRKNGLWISDDNIYPVNFERTYYAGIKYKF